MLRLQRFIGGRGVSADQKKTPTISLNCGVTHSPGKIEYNCRYFIMTFRTQIHKKKFCKKCFRNLQGSMSHRPLTNTSSLKIAAAYCPPPTFIRNPYYLSSYIPIPSHLLSCSFSFTVFFRFFCPFWLPTSFQSNPRNCSNIVFVPSIIPNSPLLVLLSALYQS